MLEDAPNEKLFIPYICYIQTYEYFLRDDPDDAFFEIIEEKIDKLAKGECVEARCVELFRQYLIDPTKANFLNLQDMWEQLPLDKRALFEHQTKDPLMNLIKLKGNISKQERAYYLRDYFEGE